MEISQKIINMVREIGKRDGKAGITSDEERNELAQRLASGEIEGTENQKYIKSEIGKYDLKKLAKDVRDGVKKTIEKAMRLSGDSEHINSQEELATIEQIIQNTTGKYTREEVEYAKLVREHKMSEQFALEVENNNYKRENARLKDENAKLKEDNAIYEQKVTELMKENEALRAELNVRQGAMEGVQGDLSNAEESVEELPENQKVVCQDIIASVKHSINKIQQNDKEAANIDSQIKTKEDGMKKGTVSQRQFAESIAEFNKKLDNLNKSSRNEVGQIKNSVAAIQPYSSKIADKLNNIAVKLSNSEDISDKPISVFN